MEKRVGSARAFRAPKLSSRRSGSSLWGRLGLQAVGCGQPTRARDGVCRALSLAPRLQTTASSFRERRHQRSTRGRRERIARHTDLGYLE